MRNVLSLLSLLAVVATFTSGCAGPEEKLGRGIRNTGEIVRLGALQNSVEQTGVWDSPQDAATTGVIVGVGQTFERTGLGLVEIITFPFPPYHPIFTKYIPAEPVFSDSYRPTLPDDPIYQTDHYIGISGGNIAGFVPGSQFDIFGP
jgi:putative exosortase-associated protein (TIGR04073 family)